MHPSDKYKYIDSKEAEKLLDAIEEQLKTSFEKIRNEKYNPNTKGYDYEKTLQEFCNDYLNGGFDFQIRVGVLDSELQANTIFDPKENEFDIVATYKNAVPKLVHHHLVPYDSVAFVTEVKQTLTLPNIEKDLAKLEKLSKLPISNNRGGLYADRRIFQGYRINRPLRILFYYEAKAKPDKVYKLLEGSFAKSWDLCIVLKEEVILLNSTLPYVQKLWKEAHFVRDFKYPLLKGMFFACAFTEGNFNDSWVIFWNLFRSLVNKHEMLTK
jgi:hypothetical protein